MAIDLQPHTDDATHHGYSDLPRLMSRLTGDEKHGPAATSTLDVLWVLYDQILDVTPATVDSPTRDRFLLSKGHGPMAYYAVLTAKGFLDESWLTDFGGWNSRLGYHPDRLLVPGVEISSGSLGHGLPLAVGLALGLRAQHNPARVVTLIGDAEFDEGSNAEAVVFAGAVGLDNLTVVMIDNHSSTHGWTDGPALRFAVEGWTTHTVGGRDHPALARAFRSTAPGRPTAVIADLGPEE